MANASKYSPARADRCRQTIEHPDICLKHFTADLDEVDERKLLLPTTNLGIQQKQLETGFMCCTVQRPSGGAKFIVPTSETLSHWHPTRNSRLDVIAKQRSDCTVRDRAADIYSAHDITSVRA